MTSKWRLSHFDYPCMETPVPKKITNLSNESFIVSPFLGCLLQEVFEFSQEKIKLIIIAKAQLDLFLGQMFSESVQIHSVLLFTESLHIHSVLLFTESVHIHSVLFFPEFVQIHSVLLFTEYVHMQNFTNETICKRNIWNLYGWVRIRQQQNCH